MRRAILKMRDAEAVEGGGHAVADFSLRPAHLQRAKGHFIEDGGVENLHVGVLEDETHLATEPDSEIVVGEGVFGQFGVAESDRALLTEVEAVENAQERRFAGAISADDSDATTFGNGEAEIVERGLIFVAEFEPLDFEYHRLPAQIRAMVKAANAAPAAQSRRFI